MIGEIVLLKNPWQRSAEPAIEEANRQWRDDVVGAGIRYNAAIQKARDKCRHHFTAESDEYGDFCECRKCGHIDRKVTT